MTTFKHYGNNNIRISLYQEPGSSGDGISFVAAYPDENLWIDGYAQLFDDKPLFCHKNELSRSEWAAHMLYENHNQAVSDFKNAIKEFNKGNFEHPVTLYFLASMLGLIVMQTNKQEFEMEINSAIDIYNKRLAVEPKDIDTLNYKAAALYELGKCRDAIDIYDKILKIGPEHDYPQSYPVTYPLAL